MGRFLEFPVPTNSDLYASRTVRENVTMSFRDSGASRASGSAVVNWATPSGGHRGTILYNPFQTTKTAEIMELRKLPYLEISKPSENQAATTSFTDH